MIIIDEYCGGCGECQLACPINCIDVKSGKAAINNNCMNCEMCMQVCPKNAISKNENTPLFHNKKYNNNRSICILAEHYNNELTAYFPELVEWAISLSKELKEVKITVLVLGENVDQLVEEILSYDIDEVWIIENSRIGYFNEDVLANLSNAILSQQKPEIFLGMATILGRSLFPRIGSKLKTGLTADCTNLSIDKETKLLIQTRPTFGGNILAEIFTEEHRPQMVTIRPGIGNKAKKNKNNTKGKKIYFHGIEVPLSGIELVDIIKKAEETNNLEDAEIIVGFGRGIQNEKNLNLIHQLANKLDATIGASRAAVDNGWFDSSHQIGQSGKIVRPALYIACGISGAIQHQIGIMEAKYIIAINKDKNAPIFNIADIGIVGDLTEIIPELLKQLDN